MGQQGKVTKDKKCDECDFVTHKTYSLKRHKQCHVKSTEKLLETFKCSECEKTFKNKKTLGDHIRHTHKQKKTTKKCDLCSYETYKNYNLKMHQKTHDKEPLEYFNCEFKPIAIKSGKGSEPVMKTFPPDPLHCNLLGPCNDAIEKMEFLWGDVMLEFYRRHALKKSGQSAGGKFNGVDIRLILKESSLQELATMLPVEAEPFLNYFRSIKELHSAVVAKEYSYSLCEKSVFDYEVNFWHLHEQFSLPMTLKVHVILDHYMWYFKEMSMTQTESMWKLYITA